MSHKQNFREFSLTWLSNPVQIHVHRAISFWFRFCFLPFIPHTFHAPVSITLLEGVNSLGVHKPHSSGFSVVPSLEAFTGLVFLLYWFTPNPFPQFLCSFFLWILPTLWWLPTHIFCLLMSQGVLQTRGAFSPFLCVCFWLYFEFGQVWSAPCFLSSWRSGFYTLLRAFLLHVFTTISYGFVVMPCILQRSGCEHSHSLPCGVRGFSPLFLPFRDPWHWCLLHALCKGENPSVQKVCSIHVYSKFFETKAGQGKRI